MHESILAETVSYERRVWDALIAGDSEADGALLTDDFLGVYPTGFADRDEHMASAATPRFSSYRISDARLIEVSGRARLLSYRAEYRQTGATVDEVMFITSLWVRDGLVWKNSFSQDTPQSSGT